MSIKFRFTVDIFCSVAFAKTLPKVGSARFLERFSFFLLHGCHPIEQSNVAFPPKKKAHLEDVQAGSIAAGCTQSCNSFQSSLKGKKKSSLHHIFIKCGFELSNLEKVKPHANEADCIALSPWLPMLKALAPRGKGRRMTRDLGRNSGKVWCVCFIMQARYNRAIADPQRGLWCLIWVVRDKLAHRLQEFTPPRLGDGCNAFVSSIVVCAHTRI